MRSTLSDQKTQAEYIPFTARVSSGVDGGLEVWGGGAGVGAWGVGLGLGWEHEGWGWGGSMGGGAGVVHCMDPGC